MSIESAKLISPDSRLVHQAWSQKWNQLGFAYHHLLIAETILANLTPSPDHELFCSFLCLLAEARDQGHLCLPLPGLSAAWLAHPGAEQFPVLDLEAPQALVTRMCQAGLATKSSEEGSAPLVLVEADGQISIYFRGMYLAETALIRLLEQQLAQPIPAAVPAIHSWLDHWFAGLTAASRPSGLQTMAVHQAIDNRLFILSGGPGTGKTTTVFHILHGLWRAAGESAGPEGLRLALVAPTGRAAARIHESLSSSLERNLEWLNDGPGRSFAAAIRAGKGQTLHRLLGLSSVFSPYEPDRALLPFDVIVVDEASMVDVHQMGSLLSRLAPATRLLLVGDRNQLPSVGAGSILADLVAAGPPGSALANIQLEQCFRSDTAILDCAKDILAGKVPDLGNQAAAPAVRCMAINPARPANLQRSQALGAWAAELQLENIVKGCLDPRPENIPGLFAAASSSILLSPLRNGPFGVTALNDQILSLIQAALPPAGLGGGLHSNWLPGMMVMATRNDYERGLFNGDRGLLCRCAGRLLAWFPSGKQFSPQTIPGLEPAWAITVHKSQGSEFGAVWLFLGESSQGEGAVSRELLYTGLTRARSQLVLVADQAALEKACRTGVDRYSLIRQRFRKI